MDRRTFLRTTGAALSAVAAGGLATPAISQRAGAGTLRLVPNTDLANFDPIWNPAYIARNAGLLVWDTLYGVDNKLQPQRQMIESEDVSSDGLTWTFRLRPGLKFHDGEAVLPKDALASINRWAAREPMGQMIKAIENELVAIDDRTFVCRSSGHIPKCCSRWAKWPRRAALSCRRASRDRSVQTNYRICRLRPNALCQDRMGIRREGGV